MKMGSTRRVIESKKKRNQEIFVKTAIERIGGWTFFFLVIIIPIIIKIIFQLFFFNFSKRN